MGRTPEVKAEAHAEVRSTVEAILGDVESFGDEAARRYSESFDGWSPETSG